MKRRREEEKEKCVVIPSWDDEIVLPNEVWAIIILMRFSDGINQLHEYNELIAYYTINQRFKCILYQQVIPRIECLASQIIHLCIKKSLLPRFRSLIKLQLYERLNIGDDELKSLSFIPELGLSNLSIVTDRGLLELTRLRRLDMTCNRHIKGVHLHQLPHLTALSLRGSSLVTNECLKELSQLRKLDLTFNSRINNEGLKRLTALETLKLAPNTNISDEGIIDLPLRKLYLSHDCLITDAAITRLTRLQKLSLEYNDSIKNEGLSVLTTLTELDLFCNITISDSGISSLHQLKRLGVMGSSNISTQYREVLGRKGVVIY